MQNPWNVLQVTSFVVATVPDNNSSALDLKLFAAELVYDITSILSAVTWADSNKYAKREDNTLVLPLPGPAIRRVALLVVFIASFWSTSGKTSTSGCDDENDDDDDDDEPDIY